MQKTERPNQLKSFLSAYYEEMGISGHVVIKLIFVSLFLKQVKTLLTPKLALCQATKQALKPLFFDSNACAGLSAEKGCGPNDRSLIKKE